MLLVVVQCISRRIACADLRRAGSIAQRRSRRGERGGRGRVGQRLCQRGQYYAGVLVGLGEMKGKGVGEDVQVVSVGAGEDVSLVEAVEAAYVESDTADLDAFMSVGRDVCFQVK